MADTLDLENHISKYYHLQSYNDAVHVLLTTSFFLR